MRPLKIKTRVVQIVNSANIQMGSNRFRSYQPHLLAVQYRPT